MITYKQSNLNKLNATSLKRLIPLTFGNDGLMINHIEHHLNQIDSGYKRYNDNHIIVAYDDKKPIGWSLCLSINSNDSDLDKTAYIGVFIKPSHRRKGIGSELIKKMKQFLNSTGINKISVSPHDDTSVKFYTKLGVRDKQKAKEYGDVFLKEDFVPGKIIVGMTDEGNLDTVASDKYPGHSDLLNDKYRTWLSKEVSPWRYVKQTKTLFFWKNDTSHEIKTAVVEFLKSKGFVVNKMENILHYAPGSYKRDMALYKSHGGYLFNKPQSKKKEMSFNADMPVIAENVSFTNLNKRVMLKYVVEDILQKNLKTFEELKNEHDPNGLNHDLTSAAQHKHVDVLNQNTV